MRFSPNKIIKKQYDKMRRYRLFLLAFAATIFSIKMAAQFYTLRSEVAHVQVRPVKHTVTKQKKASVGAKQPDVTFQTGHGLEITIGKDIPLFVNVKDSLLFSLISQRMNVCLPLDFLKPGTKYRATIYADGPDADWKTNPTSYTISEREVSSADTLEVAMAPGGGQAVSFMPAI